MTTAKLMSIQHPTTNQSEYVEPVAEEAVDEGEDAKVVELVSPVNEAPNDAGINADANDTDQVSPTKTVFPLKQRPDDPGVDEEKGEGKSRFKLF